MRVYKPTYTTPLPEGAKILKRKSGKVAKFTNARGEEIIALLSKSGRRVKMETNCYYIEFRDHDNYCRRLKAFTDESSSQRLAQTVEDILNAKGSGQGISTDLRRKIEALPRPMRTELARWGLLDESANMASRPLPEIAKLYITHLQAQELNGRYVRRTAQDLDTIFRDCGFLHLTDIDADRVNSYLKRRRDGGIGYRRSNGLLTVAKCFMNWAVDRGYIAQSPLRGRRAELLDEEKDRRRIRRALEIKELRRLFEAAESSEADYDGIPGPERALLYRLAAETGIRRGELSKLTVGDFDLVGLTVTVQGKVAKNGKERTVPLSPIMATRLRQHFSNKLPTAPAIQVPFRTAEMLRVDLKRAGIEYVDDRGHYFDFHSLRGECATLLVESGVDPKVAMKILGHSDIRLTMQVYAKTLDEKAKHQQAAASLSDMIEKAG